MNQASSMRPPDSALGAALDGAAVPDGARRVLRAAAGLFARKGYAPTTVRNIAAAADVTVPMVYYYFEGKEQIFKLLFDNIAHHLFDRIGRVRERGGRHFQQQLVAIARVFRDLLYPCPVALQLMTQFIFGPCDSCPVHGAQTQYDQLTNQCHKLFESAIESGRFRPTPGYEVDQLSMYFINMVRSHMMTTMKWLEKPGADPRQLYEKFLADEVLDQLVGLYLQGAGAIGASDAQTR